MNVPACSIPTFTYIIPIPLKPHFVALHQYRPWEMDRKEGTDSPQGLISVKLAKNHVVQYI